MVNFDVMSKNNIWDCMNDANIIDKVLRDDGNASVTVLGSKKLMLPPPPHPTSTRKIYVSTIVLFCLLVFD